LRGNVDTRHRAALEGKFDGVILAAAGLQRLGLLDEHAAVLPPEECLPQAGQGALALEIRASDETSISIVRAIHDACAGACVEAERAVLAGLAAGCQAPVAAYATLREGRLEVQGLVAGLVGEQVLRAARTGAPEDAEALGKAVAADLRRLGADALLEQSRRLDE
jgi:hydroxymethylbilane synthase